MPPTGLPKPQRFSTSDWGTAIDRFPGDRRVAVSPKSSRSTIPLAFDTSPSTPNGPARWGILSVEGVKSNLSGSQAAQGQNLLGAWSHTIGNLKFQGTIRYLSPDYVTIQGSDRGPGRGNRRRRPDVAPGYMPFVPSRGADLVPSSSRVST